MAIYHLSVSIVKRSVGRSVTAAAAYRAAAVIKDITTGIIHNYSKKRGVDYSEIFSPVASNENSKWLTNREKLWNKVEETEKRKDSQLAREVTLAIPQELPKEKKIALVSEYVNKNYVNKGMIADVNIHHLDGENPHAHILLTMRNLAISPDGVVEFGLKNTDWDSRNLLIDQRKQWEEISNKYLSDFGSEARIDCRSLKEQGSPLIPQIHIGVHAMAMHRKGISTERREEFERIEAANNLIRETLERAYQQDSPESQRDTLAEFVDRLKLAINKYSGLSKYNHNDNLVIAGYRIKKVNENKIDIKEARAHPKTLATIKLEDKWSLSIKSDKLTLSDIEDSLNRYEQQINENSAKFKTIVEFLDRQDEIEYKVNNKFTICKGYGDAKRFLIFGGQRDLHLIDNRWVDLNPNYPEDPNMPTMDSIVDAVKDNAKQQGIEIKEITEEDIEAEGIKAENAKNQRLEYEKNRRERKYNYNWRKGISTKYSISSQKRDEMLQGIMTICKKIENNRITNEESEDERIEAEKLKEKYLEVSAMKTEYLKKEREEIKHGELFDLIEDRRILEEIGVEELDNILLNYIRAVNKRLEATERNNIKSQELEINHLESSIKEAKNTSKLEIDKVSIQVTEINNKPEEGSIIDKLAQEAKERASKLGTELDRQPKQDKKMGR